MEKFNKQVLSGIAAKHYKDLLINGADFEGHGLSVADTAADKAEALAGVFLSEYGFNIGRLGVSKASKEYLMGLPSVLNYPFSNYDIIVWMEEKAGQKIPEDYYTDAVEIYWSRLGGAFGVLVGKYIRGVQ